MRFCSALPCRAMANKRFQRTVLALRARPAAEPRRYTSQETNP